MFDAIKIFLLEHWELVLSSLLFLVSFVLGLVKKKPVLNKLDLILKELYVHIPVFIDLVEKNGHGAEKKALVLQLCKEFLQTDFGFNDFQLVEGLVSSFIENVLITPQKKLYNFDEDDKEV